MIFFHNQLLKSHIKSHKKVQNDGLFPHFQQYIQQLFVEKAILQFVKSKLVKCKFRQKFDEYSQKNIKKIFKKRQIFFSDFIKS